MLGTDSQRISRYQTGKITPSLDAIVRTAQALNVSIDHLPIDDIPRRRFVAPTRMRDLAVWRVGHRCAAL